MMEPLHVSTVIQILGNFGPVGLVMFFWWYGDKKMTSMMRRYEQDMAETRQMYKDNVELVRGYKDLAKDLKDIIVLNAQCLTEMNSNIDQNQFCPLLRVEKKQIAVGAGE